jgi:DNA-binding Xre family transcriptional regulator
MKNSKKFKSDYDEFVASPKRKKLVEKKYKELCLSELLLSLMEEQELSVRELAKAVGISPTIIQGIRSGKNQNITLETLLELTSTLGGKVKIDFGGKLITLRD